jgi:UDP:flavonoid glycosyltransferase YjiC (YdhE family)
VEANEVVVGELFGRLNTTAALPRLREACEEWRPDVVLRDPNEYGSALAAELHSIPHARVAIGLASTEELGMGIAASAIDAIRKAEGLPPDPDADRLRRAPYLSLFPPTLDEGAQPDTQRFHDPAWDEPPGELLDWWPGREREPLVYVTFGSVAGSFPQALPVYGVAMRAVAELPVRVLLTVGRELDLDALPPAPENVRVERWVPQQDVLGHAAAALVHGGSGSTLGALAAGMPLVVMPLFADQPQNARRVAEVGAGVAVEPNRDDLDATVSPLRQAIRTVLDDPSYGRAARALADELRAQPPVDDALPLFERFARS